MAYHPISGCTKSSIENVKSQTQHSEPTDAMDANEFSVVTTFFLQLNNYMFKMSVIKSHLVFF